MRYIFNISNKIDMSKLLLETTKVPILILDKVWLENFPERLTNEKIQSLEQNLLDLLKENANLTEREKELQLNKKRYLNEIINLTPEAYEKNNVEAKNKINQLSNLVNNANNELEEVSKRLSKLPNKLEKANRTLLQETVNICYNKSKESAKKLENINPIIEQLRSELKQLIDEKTVLEETMLKSYTLLHDIVGVEIIEALDNKSEKAGNKKWF